MDLQKLFSRKDMLQAVTETLVPLLILRKVIVKTLQVTVQIAMLTNQEMINLHAQVVEITSVATNENHSYLKIKFIK
jgi:hypothetical protein